MKTFDRLSDKIEFYRQRFNEGTEIEDAVQFLLSAADVLNGLSADHELALTLLTAEKLMRDYMDFARNRGVDWEEYQEIDAELYTYLLGGAQKLTEEQYRGTMSDVVVDFYAHEGIDPYGRTLQDMIALTDYQLEASHDVIQWMFPLHEESNFNENAPLVTPKNVEILRTKLCQDRIQEALLRYATFLGFEYADGQFRPTENFVHRAKVWRRHSNHNYLRITRVIQSLRLFGLDVLAKQFADACHKVVFDVGAASEQTYKFWKKALLGDVFDTLR